MDTLQILLVDDDPHLQDNICQRLSRSLTVVTCSPNGDDALEKLAAIPVDVAIINVNLGGMGGISLVRRIRVHHPDLPVILIRSHEEMRMICKGMEQGAADYLHHLAKSFAQLPAEKRNRKESPLIP